MQVMKRGLIAMLDIALAILPTAADELRIPTDSWAGRKSHLAVVNPAVPVVDGNVLSLRGEWEFSDFRHALEARDMRYHLDKDFWGKDSAAWKNLRTILVPGCWEAQGVGKAGVGVGCDCKPNEGLVGLRHAHVGNGFYRKRVTIPSAWAGKRVWLKVGQARTWAWAWIDDKPVAHFSEAHRALKWEVTDLVSPGKTCEIKFQVDNAYIGYRNTGTLSVHRWGGLTRDVELEATPLTFIDDVWVRGDFDRQEAEAHVEIAGKREEGGEKRVRVTVEDETKEIVLGSTSAPSTYTLELPLWQFRAWSPEHPNLYTAKVELVSTDGTVLQTRFERFGVRKLEVRGKEFYLNGHPFFFRGFGDDHTYPITGMSPASKDYHLAHLKRARSAGFNFVRTHTHCELPEYFDAADEAGILVQPEHSYNCDISSVETFTFDPVGDAEALWQGYRRHPSFAVYSGGNEGTLGPAGTALFDWVHGHDLDRLVIEQDGGTYLEGHREDKSDYASGPMSMWERGSFNRRAFICHEYANLAVKGDARMEDDYSGVWLPRMTREMRRTNLKPAGLGDEWGDRLQDAQHDFQRMWAIRSVEAARKDPFCDGYIFWTIVDYTHFDAKMNAPNCQGLWDPFWRTKPHGTSPEDMAVVNSRSAILLDTEGRVRTYREDSDPMLCCGSIRRLVIDETNRVFAVGETIPAEFILAHYGERPLIGAKLSWSLEQGTRVLVSGTADLGDRSAGPAATVAKARIVVPEIGCPGRAVLKAVVSCQRGTSFANAWDFWLFPRTERPEVPENVVVADFGSEDAVAARRTGKNILLVGNRKGERDIYPGWWATDWRWPHDGWTQNGVAAVPHPLFGAFPYESFLSPLLFRIIGQGTPLPVEGFEERDFVMAGEGNTDFKLYLAAKTRSDGGREVFVSGLDVFADVPEARTLLKGILTFLTKEDR